MDRKKFIGLSVTGGAALLTNPLSAIARNKQPGDPYKIDLVKEFVIAGHGDLAKVKELLANYPNLLFCSYDWGNGDFEQAIEGAGHVGNKEIARYLVEQGARPNLFVMTMLGETTFVKTAINKYPNLLNAAGPHGFSLLHHAKKGGEDAKKLLNWFEKKGLKEMQYKIR